MSARHISSGSQPAVRISCDEAGCGVSEVVFLDTKFRARMALARQMPWACAHPPTYEEDFCPVHACMVRP